MGSTRVAYDDGEERAIVKDRRGRRGVAGGCRARDIGSVSLPLVAEWRGPGRYHGEGCRSVPAHSLVAGCEAIDGGAFTVSVAAIAGLAAVGVGYDHVEMRSTVLRLSRRASCNSSRGSADRRSRSRAIGSSTASAGCCHVESSRLPDGDGLAHGLWPTLGGQIHDQRDVRRGSGVVRAVGGRESRRERLATRCQHRPERRRVHEGSRTSAAASNCVPLSAVPG